MLPEFKEYLRIDGNYEDALLDLLLHSAIEALKNAGVKIPEDLEEVEKGYALHRLAIYTLAAHYYENRQVVSSDAQNIVPYSVQHMILQLKVGAVHEPW